MNRSAQDALRGGTRALTADLVGAPVDLLTQALNLGIAGGGYLGHKAGLLESPPELLERPVGGSDWMAEKMGLEGDSPAYERSRLLTGLAAAMLSPSKRIGGSRASPGLKAKQRGIVSWPAEVAQRAGIQGEILPQPGGERARIIAKDSVFPTAWDAMSRRLKWGETVPIGDLGGIAEKFEPLANVNVRTELLPPSLLGSYSPGKREIAINTSVAQNPQKLAALIAHESTHALDDIAGMAGRGYSVPDATRLAEMQEGIKASTRPNELLAAMKKSPTNFDLYQRELGETNARIAEHLVMMQKRNPSTVAAVAQNERLGANNLIIVVDMQGRELPIPMDLLKSGKLVMQGRSIFDTEHGKRIGYLR